MSETIEFFREWRFDRRRGAIEGLHPVDPERMPFQHCRLVTDASGRLVRLEEHRQEYALPAIKLLGYADEENPRIAEALDYNPEGSLRLIHRYFYDESGRMIRRDELNGEEQPRGHVASTWDEAGNEVEECAYLPNGQVHSRHCYEYDDAGNLVREKIFDGKGAHEGTREMDYDDRGNVVEKRWFTPDGTLQSRFVHSFDADSRVIRSELHGGDGECRAAQDFAYDDFGNPIDPELKAQMEADARAREAEEAQAAEALEGDAEPAPAEAT